jgi:antitoxin VapB
MMTATLFQHGDSQAVQLPKTIQFPGTEVYIKQVGNALVLLPHGASVGRVVGESEPILRGFYG